MNLWKKTAKTSRRSRRNFWRPIGFEDCWRCLESGYSGRRPVIPALMFYWAGFVQHPGCDQAVWLPDPDDRRYHQAHVCGGCRGSFGTLSRLGVWYPPGETMNANMRFGELDFARAT